MIIAGTIIESLVVLRQPNITQVLAPRGHFLLWLPSDEPQRAEIWSPINAQGLRPAERQQLAAQQGFSNRTLVQRFDPAVDSTWKYPRLLNNSMTRDRWMREYQHIENDLQAALLAIKALEHYSQGLAYTVWHTGLPGVAKAWKAIGGLASWPTMAHLAALPVE